MRKWAKRRIDLLHPGTTMATHFAQARAMAVPWAAGFWGLMLFMPVGMNYLAFLLLMLATLLAGQYAQRAARVRQHLMWWPLVFFVGWTLLTLALQTHSFKETPANLWHGMRIVLTLGLALSLTRREARSAIAGASIAFTLVLLLLLGFHAGLIPDAKWWTHLTQPTTQKSIAASIFFSLLATTAWVLVWTHKDWRRWAALAGVLVALAVIVWALGKRTAMLGFLLGLLAVAVHQWRAKRFRIALSFVAVGLFAVAMYLALPQLRGRIDQGAQELESALNGKVANESWNIRIQMIRHTSDMIAERPLSGWGIGAWNDQWRERVPDFLDGYNMPHNDLLWMGAQAGIPGALAWLALFLSAAWAGWRIPTWQGRAAFAIALVALFSSLINSGTRDAEIGLPMLWLLGVSLALARASSSSRESGS